jgi:putative addiction module killer protein
MSGRSLAVRVAPARVQPARGGIQAAQLAGAHPVGFSDHAIEIRQTDEYQRWFEGLRDRTARFRIGPRIRRVSLGNCGDIKPVGEGVSELRIQFGPGYRAYLAQRGDALIILLADGDKSTQQRDIERAQELARGL